MMFSNAAELIYEFPWLAPKDDWNEPTEFYNDDDAWTEVDGLPVGWKEGFLEEMLYEINEVVNEYDFAETYTVTSALDYHGVLKWAHTGYPPEASKEIKEIIKKYEHISTKTCMECGREGKMYSVGGRFLVLCDLHKPDEDDIDVLL
jgi:hypothetical protein